MLRVFDPQNPKTRVNSSYSPLTLYSNGPGLFFWGDPRLRLPASLLKPRQETLDHDHSVLTTLVEYWGDLYVAIALHC